MILKRLILTLALFVFAASAADKNSTEPWTRAIVTIEAGRKVYEYLQPWSRRVDQVQKMGVIVGNKEILTTADFMNDLTMVRLQKGRGRWYSGKLLWVDYHANLALVGCEEDGFWNDTKKVDLAAVTPRIGTAQLVRWRAGALEMRNVELNRITVKKGKMSFIDVPFLDVDSEIAGVGWAEAIVQGNKVIGITSSKEEHSITVIPSFFIRECLADRAKEPYQGLGYFPFVWHPAENPETLQYLGLKGEPRGVIITQVNTNKHASPMRSQDILLEVDGHKIDVQGDYKDPDYGDLLLENLATRNRRAGDTVKLKIFRDGEERELDYTLPRVDYRTELVPMATPDQEPEYLIIGGLIFQPLTVPYLSSWGSDWARKAPFRLSYATREHPKDGRRSYVVLTGILPDPVNIGYNDARSLLVDKFNGEKIYTLHDLANAMKNPKDGFHLLEFIEGDSLRRIVLDAGEIEASTRRVLERYGIQSDRYMISPSAGSLRLTAD